MRTNSLTDKPQHEFINIYTIGCRQNFSNDSGLITSPLYPNQYPDNVECVYVISQKIGTFVNVTFINLDIVCQGTGTTSDYLEMRDGYSEESPFMGRYCGNGTNVPTFLQSTQNFLRIRWDTYTQWVA